MTRLLRTWFLREWFDFTEGGQEDGESPEQALVREIHEELAAGVAVDGFLTTVVCVIVIKIPLFAVPFLTLVTEHQFFVRGRNPEE